MPTFTNNTVGDEHAIVGVAEKGIGVFGRSQTNNTGVGGMSDSGIGVHGVSETADGVFGVSENGRGVFGGSTTGTGVGALSELREAPRGSRYP